MMIHIKKGKTEKWYSYGNCFCMSRLVKSLNHMFCPLLWQKWKVPLLILTLSPHDMFNMPLNFLIPTQLWFSPNTSHPLHQPQYEYWTASIYWAVKTLQFIPSFSFCMFFFLHIEKDELVQWYIDIIRWLHVAKHVKPNITNLNIRYPEVYFP